MGKITRKSDREDTPRPRRKRRKKDLDNIHLKILKAKRKLDNVGKDGKKNGQKKHGGAKICSRLLPRPFAGIYRNGAKGKDIRNERSVNTVVKARLEGDALQLFSGDTSESKSEVESTIYDKTIKQSSEKEFVKNSLEWTPYTFEHSPVFGKKQGRNQKQCLIKKKNGETLFEKCDSNKLRKQDINDSKCIVQKEDMCKRKLFQNDREQSDNNSTTQIQIFDNVDLLEEKIVSKKKREQICPEGSKSKVMSWDPLSRYMELCARISVENYEEGFLKNYESDPLTTTIKKLRQIYANSYRQQLLRDKMRRLNPESSMEFQACTNSDNSRLSSVEFEVSKCSENHTTAIRLQEDTSQMDKFCLNSAQSGEFKENGDKTQYNSTSYLSQDTFIEPVTNTSLAENYKNNDKQYAKQSSSNIHHSSSRLLSFYFVDEKAAVRLNSRKNPNQVNFSSKNNRYDQEYTNSFHIDIPTSANSRSVNKTAYLETSIFPNTLSAERHLSRNRTHVKLPIKLIDKCKSVAISGNHLLNNAFRKCNNKTANKHNAKNIRRVPTILRRCNNNVTANKNDCHIQVNGGYMENLCKQSEVNPINESSGNNITEKFYETAFSNMFKNLPTPSTADITLDRSDVLESHIGSMKIKNSQESQAGKCEVNVCSSEDRTDEFCQFDGCLHSRAFEDSHNTSIHIEKAHTQRKQVVPNMRKQHFSHPINNRSTNHLQDMSFSNVTIEPAKQFFQTKSQVDSSRHTCENGSKKMLFTKCTRDQNQNIFLKSIKVKSMPMENHTQDNRTNKKCGASARKEMFNKADVECTENHSNQNTCHCSKRYTCVNSTDFPQKCNVSQTCHFHEKITQPTTEPEISHDLKGCTGNCTGNCAHLLNNAQNVQLLSLEPKHSYMYQKAADKQCHAMLLQNVAQPIKYLAVKNSTNIQRVPIYVNEGSIGITENLPLKVVTLMDSTSSRARAFPQEITTQVIPLQTSGLQLNDLAMRNDSDQTFTKRLNCVNAVLLNPDLQPSTWYPTNL